ncbi:hypothetical protein AVEN_1603-1 [Araneus ventricosus]|uniref:Uncharacterized protein n=1 Tax=Araneus ventricosus TaxID=182803 RepID=A0A4Y2DT32_ARAVE|nr:hypothetical protein AVEN_1603-1 [Araneus ventricosus]
MIFVRPLPCHLTPRLAAKPSLLFVSVFNHLPRIQKPLEFYFSLPIIATATTEVSPYYAFYCHDSKYQCLTKKAQQSIPALISSSLVLLHSEGLGLGTLE